MTVSIPFWMFGIFAGCFAVVAFIVASVIADKVNVEGVRFFIPQFIKIHAKSEPAVDATKKNFNLEKAFSWWRNDSYTKIKRYKGLKWCGKVWFKLPARKRTIKSEFWDRSAKDIVKLVKELNIGLNKNSIVFEGGCSVGRNLHALHKAFNCGVEGVDISHRAINLAYELWRKRGVDRHKFRFYCHNVLKTDFFQSISKGHYDLVITRWHLIHLPRSQQKVNYINELKRIGKVVILIEPIANHHRVELCQGNTYCLSWDRWEDYGFRWYRKLKESEVFIYRRSE